MGRSFAHRRTFATKHALLRVIPTVTNYSATVSDISSGSIYIYYSDILIWHSTWHLFWHPIWHPFLVSILIFSLAFYLASVLTFFLLAFFLASILAFSLTWALRSAAYGWCPAVPTAIWSSRFLSGSAHWDLELAVEVRQCLLRSQPRRMRRRKRRRK